jgi:hypothetical protein
MPLRHALPAAVTAVLMALPGCTSDDEGDPDTPPTEMQARLIQGEDSKTYDMTACAMTGEQSLTVYATDGESELLVVTIVNGAGDVSLLDGTPTPAIEGTATAYTPDPDGMFMVDGVHLRDGEELSFSVWGNCNKEPEA